MHHAVERSLVCLILVLRRDGDAIEEVAIAKQRREDRHRFTRLVTSETLLSVAASPLRPDRFVLRYHLH